MDRCFPCVHCSKVLSVSQFPETEQIKIQSAATAAVRSTHNAAAHGSCIRCTHVLGELRQRTLQCMQCNMEIAYMEYGRSEQSRVLLRLENAMPKQTLPVKQGAKGSGRTESTGQHADVTQVIKNLFSLVEGLISCQLCVAGDSGGGSGEGAHGNESKPKAATKKEAVPKAVPKAVLKAETAKVVLQQPAANTNNQTTAQYFAQAVEKLKASQSGLLLAGRTQTRTQPAPATASSVPAAAVRWMDTAAEDGAAAQNKEALKEARKQAAEKEAKKEIKKRKGARLSYEEGASSRKLSATTVLPEDATAPSVAVVGPRKRRGRLPTAAEQPYVSSSMVGDGPELMRAIPIVLRTQGRKACNCKRRACNTCHQCEHCGCQCPGIKRPANRNPCRRQKFSKYDADDFVTGNEAIGKVLEKQTVTAQAAKAARDKPKQPLKGAAKMAQAAKAARDWQLRRTPSKRSRRPPKNQTAGVTAAPRENKISGQYACGTEAKAAQKKAAPNPKAERPKEAVPVPVVPVPVAVTDSVVFGNPGDIVCAHCKTRFDVSGYSEPSLRKHIGVADKMYTIPERSLLALEDPRLKKIWGDTKHCLHLCCRNCLPFAVRRSIEFCCSKCPVAQHYQDFGQQEQTCIASRMREACEGTVRCIRVAPTKPAKQEGTLQKGTSNLDAHGTWTPAFDKKLKRELKGAIEQQEKEGDGHYTGMLQKLLRDTYKKASGSLYTRTAGAATSATCRACLGDVLDMSLVEHKLRPFVNARMVDYIGEEEPRLVGYVCVCVIYHGCEYFQSFLLLSCC